MGFFNRNTSVSYAFLFMYLLVLISCLNRDQKTEDLLRSQQHQDNQTADAALSDRGNLVLAMENQEPFGTLDYRSCLPDALTHDFSIPVSTAFGVQQLHLTYSLKDHSAKLVFEDQKQLLTLEEKTPYPSEIVTQLCQKPSVATESFKNDNPLVVHVLNTLKEVGPSCNWEVSKLPTGGVSCELLEHKTFNSATFSAIDQRVQKMNDRFVSHWKRTPYFLSRRLALVSQLNRLVSKVAAKDSSELLPKDAIETYCQLLDVSFKEELPLVLSSKQWKDSFCQTEDRNRLLSLGWVGINKGLEELDVISQISDASNETAVLKVSLDSLPKDPTSRYGLRVELVPLNPVHEQVKHTMDLVLTKHDALAHQGDQHKGSATTVEAPAVSQVCWHPAFDEGTFKIANNLGLLGEGATSLTGSGCRSLEQDENTANYVLSSIIGETTFTISNGDSKTLRLPKGSYSYTLFQNKDPFQNERAVSDEPLTTQGTLQWEKGPHLVIHDESLKATN